MSIPIVVGVTGHRNLRQEDLSRLKEVVLSELQKLKNAYPNSDFIMLNSLASGADTLCAAVGVSLDMGLVCPFPFEIDEYRKDFSGEDLAKFEALLQKAENSFTVPATEPLPENLTETQRRDFGYRQAGIYVASHSHVLFALWDGKEGTPAACGTAEAVDFMLKGNYKDESLSIKSANDGAVIHILTPRQGDEIATEITATLIENEPGSLKEVLTMTDDFNRDCKDLQDPLPNSYALIPEQYLKENRRLSRIQNIYDKADALSLRMQKKYMNTIKGFSIFGVLLVFSFLLYDEIDANIFLPVYGIVMILYLVLFLAIKKINAHKKYLQYRILAESMRVQLYLCAAGINENIGNAFTWTQKHESTWVKEAAGALILGGADLTKVPDEILMSYWIDSQLGYHKKALKRDRGKQGINQKTAFGMLVASIILFLAVFVLECIARDAMDSVVIAKLPAFLLAGADTNITLSGIFKALLGVVSAVTVFLSSYYDKLSLDRMSEDHEKMIRLYQTAGEHFDRGNRDHLYRALAREEIIENGNWMSYCKENGPTFSL